jgi:hypothetical protein
MAGASALSGGLVFRQISGAKRLGRAAARDQGALSCRTIASPTATRPPSSTLP